MKIKHKSRALRNFERREWPHFFALWPRRIDAAHLAVGRIMRKHIVDDSYEYRSIEFHTREMLKPAHDTRSAKVDELENRLFRLRHNL